MKKLIAFVLFAVLSAASYAGVGGWILVGTGEQGSTMHVRNGSYDSNAGVASFEATLRDKSGNAQTALVEVSCKYGTARFNLLQGNGWSGWDIMPASSLVEKAAVRYCK